VFDDNAFFVQPLSQSKDALDVSAKRVCEPEHDSKARLFIASLKHAYVAAGQAAVERQFFL
jgi:hypothetical protein